MFEIIASIFLLLLLVFGVVMTVGAAAWGWDILSETKKPIRNLIIGVYIFVAFGLVFGLLGQIFRGEASWWVVTEVKHEYYRFGFGSAVFSAFSYLIFYSAIVFAFFYGKRYYDAKIIEGYEWLKTKEEARTIIANEMEAYRAKPYKELSTKVGEERVRTIKNIYDLTISVDWEDVPNDNISVSASIYVSSSKKGSFHLSEYFTRTPTGELVEKQDRNQKC